MTGSYKFLQDHDVGALKKAANDCRVENKSGNLEGKIKRSKERSSSTSDETAEGGFNVKACFGTALEVAEVSLSSVIHSLIIGNFAISQIALVAEEHDDDSAVDVVLELLEPALNVFEGLSVGAVISDYSTHSLSEEKRSQCFELFLP